MRLQINTAAKTIKIEDSVKLPELFTMIKRLLPNDEWKKYSLEQVAFTFWQNPIYIPFTYTVPATEPFVITCDGTTNTVFCIESN